MNPRKYIILVGDGMGDYPLQELQGRTPLEASETPGMDEIARRGRLGLVQTIPQGMEAGSDIANLNIMGYDPGRFHTGRAPLEAASMGIRLSRDEVAFRCNLVTLDFRPDGVFMEDYSAGHIGTDAARPLLESLQHHLGRDDMRFHAGVSYRHLLVWKHGPERAPSFPPHDFTGREVGSLLNDSTLPGLHELVRKSWPIFETARAGDPGLRANSIWLWGSGKAPHLPSFQQRFGLTGGVISAVDLLKGIGVYAGLAPIHVPGATGYLDTNYEGKARSALDRLADLDFIYLHVEAPDEAAHSGSLELKMRAIEDFDRRVVTPVLEGMDAFPDYRILLVTDHYTPISVRTHTREAVPFALLSRSDSVRDTKVSGFNERAAEKTGDRVDAAWKLMDLMVRS